MVFCYNSSSDLKSNTWGVVRQTPISRSTTLYFTPKYLRLYYKETLLQEITVGCKQFHYRAHFSITFYVMYTKEVILLVVIATSYDVNAEGVVSITRTAITNRQRKPQPCFSFHETNDRGRYITNKMFPVSFRKQEKVCNIKSIKRNHFHSSLTIVTFITPRYFVINW